MSAPPAPDRVPDAVLSHWAALEGGAQRKITQGLINPTFLVETGPARAIVQRLHPVFAPTVHHDIDVVTRHLAAKGLATPRLIPTDDGALWVDGEDGPWRAQSVIDGQSFDQLKSPQHAHAAGALVGRFHRAVADLHHTYVFARAGVHDTAHHYRVLQDALEAHQDHRLFGDVERAAAPVLARPVPDFSAQPRRHAHGDLKLSNLMFDDDGRGLALIDLDTLGMLPWVYEMGDALRSWTNARGEDEAPAFDRGLFVAALEGYASEAKALVTEGEARALSSGLATICAELSARFLADALNESYFGFDAEKYETRGAHNLARGIAMATLSAQVDDVKDVLDDVVVEIFR